MLAGVPLFVFDRTSSVVDVRKADYGVQVETLLPSHPQGRHAARRDAGPVRSLPPRHRPGAAGGPRGRELCCADIPLQVGKATRSHHFDVLRDAGLITSRCEGTKCLTSLRRRDLEHRFPGLLKLIGRDEAA